VQRWGKEGEKLLWNVLRGRKASGWLCSDERGGVSTADGEKRREKGEIDANGKEKVIKRPIRKKLS